MTDSTAAVEPDLRYPVGRFKAPTEITSAQRQEWIAEIQALPGKLRDTIEPLRDAQLDTPYRPGGWTVRQVVHHLADSHLNSYVRFRLALTEDNPTIKPYAEAKWAELPDAKTAPAAVSLELLEGLHERWVLLLRAMSDADFARKLTHPESGEMRLDRMLALYAWHCRHHLAHIAASVSRAS